MLNKKVIPIPMRFFGPIKPSESSQLVEMTLDDPSLTDTLTRFAEGFIEPRELAYEIQMIMEANDERMRNNEPDAMDARNDMKEACDVS